MNLKFWRWGRGNHTPSESLGAGGQQASSSGAEIPFSRFLNSHDDARGHIALSLFLINQSSEDKKKTLEDFDASVAKADGATINVFLSASQRTLERAFGEFQTKDASREAQNSYMLAEMTAAVEDRYQLTNAQLENLFVEVKALHRHNSLPRHIIIVGAATLIVTLVVVLLARLQEPIGGLMKLLGAGAGSH